MGTVYKETFTKPLPTGAKIIVRKGRRLAEWKDAKGKVLTAAEDAIIDHQDSPLVKHVAAFVAHQTAKGLNRVRVKNSENRLARLTGECGFRALGDLSAAALERWLVARQTEGMGAGTRNEYRQEMVGFANWCVRTRRLLNNPFVAVPKADAKADCRRKRRALTERELVGLLGVARRRPLAEYGRLAIRKEKTETKRKRDTWKTLPLTLEDLNSAVERARGRLAENPGFIAHLEQLGWERALIYKTLVLTGLRKGELASLTVGQLVLEGDPPYLVLDAADEKNRQGSTIPLRADLAADLREWLAYRLQTLQDTARNAPAVPFHQEPPADAPRGYRRDSDGSPGPTAIPAMLPADARLFSVPAGLLRILDRDLKAAGIPKQDERGRTADVHAMRTSFGTLLSKAGVAPRTAQAAMRHSTIDLTMNTYTDPKLLDVAGAIEALPALPLRPEDGQFDSARIAARATGTDDSTPSPLVPLLVPTHGKTRVLQSTLVKESNRAVADAIDEALAASACPVNERSPLTTAVNGLREVERRRVELPTSALRTQRSPN